MKRKSKPKPPIASQSLIRSMRLLAAIAGLALATTGEVGYSFLGAFVALFAVGMIIDRAPRLERILGLIQPALALFVLGLAISDFFYFSNSFLLAVAHFLLCLQGVRLLSVRTVRDAFGSLLVSSMMILSASTLAVEWTFFVTLFLFLPAAIWSMMLHNIALEGAEALNADDESVDNSLHERSALWRDLLPSLQASTVLGFFVATFCCFFVFVAFPRFNFRGFRGQFLQPVRQSGFVTEVDLAQSGRIFLDDAIIMRVQLNPGDLKRWPGYLRGGTLNTFNGKIWKRVPDKVERIFQQTPGEIQLPRVERQGQSLLHQNIYLESMDTPTLFSAGQPIRVKLERPFVELSDDGAIRRSSGDLWRIHYEVDSVLPHTEKDWTPPPDQSHLLLKRELQENPNFIPEVKPGPLHDLGLTMVNGAKNDLDRARRMEHFLKTNYTYSLEGNIPPGEDPLAYFLFKGKKGHCEYFASAMCVLLKEIGVPARMVTGFLSYEWNERGNYFVVRMRDAHAWVEVFIEPYGWLPFDPSPREVKRTNIRTDFHMRVTEFMDYMNLQWNRHILSYDMERQVELFQSVTSKSRRVSFRLDRMFSSFGDVSQWLNRLKKETSDVPLPGHKNELSKFLLGAALATVCLLVLVWRIRVKRHGSTIWFYFPLLSYLEHFGGPKPPFKTLREFYEAIGPRTQPHSEEIELLLSQYYRARFEPGRRLNAEDNAAIREALGRLQQ